MRTFFRGDGTFFFRFEGGVSDFDVDDFEVTYIRVILYELNVNVTLDCLNDEDDDDDNDDVDLTDEDVVIAV
jgi:hypothetical protein